MIAQLEIQHVSHQVHIFSYNRRRIYQSNEDDFRFIGLKNGYTKHENKDKMAIRKA